MSRAFVIASSQLLNRAGGGTPALPTAAPITIAGWCRPAAVNVTQTMAALAQNAASGKYFALGITSAAKPFAEASGAVTDTAIHQTSATAAAWVHLCAVFTSATLRDVYKDAVKNTTSSTTNIVPASIAQASIGAIVRPTPISYFGGDIAEVAIWNVALSQAEITMLALGVSPLLVRPASLVSYAPIMGEASPEQDVKSATNYALTGTPAKSAHPRIFDSHAALRIPPKTTASGATPKNDTDTNGTVTEAANVVVLLSAVDANGTITELAVPLAVYTALDANGVFSDVAAVSVPILGTDVNGVVTETTKIDLVGSDVNSVFNEAVALLVGESSADVNGAVTEIAKMNLASADSNSVTTETATETTVQSSTDANGVTTETGVLAAAETAVDVNGAVTEAASLRLAGSDSGTDSEANTLVTQESSADVNGTVTETATTNTPKLDTDSGTSTEVATEVATATTADSGTDSETASYKYNLATQADANAATTETGTPKAVETSSDANGATTELGSQSGNTPVSGTDSGTASDASSLAAALTVADSSTSTQTALLAALITSSDGSGSTIENALIVAKLTAAELGIGGELTNLQVTVLSPDAGGAIIEAAKVGLIGTDIGHAADAQATLVTIIDTEHGNAVEAQVLLVHGRPVVPGAPYELLGVSMEQAVITGGGPPAAVLVGAQAPPAGKITGAVKAPAQAQIAKSTIDAILSGVKKPNG